jgi:hypothetical protein
MTKIAYLKIAIYNSPKLKLTFFKVDGDLLLIKLSF